MKKTVGVLAHVDAGKTTLIEALLYNTKTIRKLGRVDHKDAFLDTDELEKKRGITIFSKQAYFDTDDTRFYILDTPGHVDFSTQIERNVKVMDYAIIVVSGVDKVQSHTKTVWTILKKYNIPTFIFVNKMDREGLEKGDILENICEKLDSNCIDFSMEDSFDEWIEKIVASDEELMEIYFENSDISKDKWYKLIAKKIRKRCIFPCFFGSALQNERIDYFIEYLSKLTFDYENKDIYDRFDYKNNIDDIKQALLVYRISHEDNRLTFCKVLKGTFKVKDIMADEKINQIRIYNGAKFNPVNEVDKGELCALTGLTNVKSGDMIIDGKIYRDNSDAILQPVLKSKVIIKDSTNINDCLSAFRILEDEEPMLFVEFNEVLKEIHINIMGTIQLEILKDMVSKRFLIDVEFGKCEIVYKETIKKSVMGVGHFEPLRHYAEAHIRLDKAPNGSGIHILSQCKTDILDSNHQNSIMHSLSVKKHKGILTGFELTDVNMVLVKGKSHLKHTEGGDFYEASTRAVRQGLFILGKENMQLLEPYYRFEISLPMDHIGRLMSDISKMYGEFSEPIIDKDTAYITGSGPVATFMEYPIELASYTKGLGRISLSFSGYKACHNEEEVIEKIGYDKDSDTDNPSFSVFCSHGAGYNVAWNEVYDHAHLKIEDVE